MLEKLSCSKNDDIRVILIDAFLLVSILVLASTVLVVGVVSVLIDEYVEKLYGLKINTSIYLQRRD